MADNASSWYDFAQRSRDDGGLGLAPHQAAGLVGNLANESGADLNPWGPSGDNGTAWGTAQWRNERLDGLKQHAQENGLDYRTPEAQQSWMRREFDTTHNGAYKALLASSTPEEAANVVNRQYEVSADRSGHRESAARAIYTDGPTAIESAMGRRPSTGSKAMAYNGDDEEDSRPALRPQQTTGALTAGGQPVAAPNIWDKIGQLMQDMAPGVAQDPDHAKVLEASAAASRKVAGDQGTWSFQTLPDGTPVRLHNRTGMMIGLDGRPVTGDHAKEVPWVHLGKDASGVDRWGPRPTDEEYAAQRKAAAEAPTGPQLLGDPTKSGAEYLKTLDPVSLQTIEGWHEGTGIAPSSFKLNDPKVQQLMASARQAYPDLDFTKLADRKTHANDMARSSPSSIGGQVTNSNTAAQNLNNLADQYIALHNNDGGVMPAIVGRGINAFSNAKADAGRSAIVQSLATHADDASGEITKVLTGGPGGTHERASRKDRLGNPNYTPTEAAGVLEAEIGDLKGKHDQIVDHVRATMGQTYLDKHPEIEKNFQEQHALLRDKVAQLRGAGTQDAPKPTAGSFKDVPWSYKKP